MYFGKNLLSEQESAALAGVSTDTIRRYHELGLLPAEIRDDTPFYSEIDLRTLFYTRIQANERNEPFLLVNRIPSAANTSSSPGVSETLNTLLAAKTDPDLPPRLQQAVEGNNQTVVEPKPAEGPVQQSESSANFNRNLPAVAYQELLEVNKGLRSQVEMLREERTWLRERVEKLEAQAERSQMLLLSDSETIRSLATHSQNKTRWYFALPWLKR